MPRLSRCKHPAWTVPRGIWPAGPPVRGTQRTVLPWTGSRHKESPSGLLTKQASPAGTRYGGTYIDMDFTKGRNDGTD